MSETPLQRAIQEALCWLPGVAIWRCNTGRRGRVQFGLRDLRGQVVGTPDLIGLVDGRFLALEIKVPGGRTEPARAAAQQARRDEIRRLGGIAAEVRSVAEAVAVVAAARAGNGGEARVGHCGKMETT